MYAHGALPGSVLLLSLLALHVTGFPLEERASPPATNITSDLGLWAPTNLTSPISYPPSANVNDWEHFTYQIPNTRKLLKGRIFTNKRIRPSALHYAIDGGIAKVNERISLLGPNINLSKVENPYTFRVPGCGFTMTSKVTRGQPTMTYGMMKDVFLALEELLEKPQRFFAASFVLVGTDAVSWGHGELAMTVASAVAVSKP